MSNRDYRQVYNRYNNDGDGQLPVTTLPDMQLNGYIPSYVSNYINQISNFNQNAEVAIGSYTNPFVGQMVNLGYAGAIYDPNNNRIYFIPFLNALQPNWHYINCDTGEMVSYAHGAAIAGVYCGGVYSPVQKRIYMAPCSTQSQAATWHYIDASTGAVVPYTHGVSAVFNGYSGGVYSPLNNRVYFCPLNQGSEATWHYVDGDTGNVVGYPGGVGVVSNISGAYNGGVYCPAKDRIYLIPSFQGNQSIYHYIDCATATVVSYANNLIGNTDPGTGNGTYLGGAYSPTLNRIYFVPNAQATEPLWQYIECGTGNLVVYTHGSSTLGSNAYGNGVFCPTDNRIYFTPRSQSSQPLWHYIDCNDGTVVDYSGYNPGFIDYFWGGCYSPFENKIYLTAWGGADAPQGVLWYYIKPLSQPGVSTSLMSGPLFNKW